MEEYNPTGPYCFKTGKRAGKCIEKLMFDNYTYLVWQMKEITKKPNNFKNELHEHLEWLLKKGEDRQPKMVCPQCGQKPVKYFSIITSYCGISVRKDFTCCGSSGCQTKLLGMAAGNHAKLEPFKFSVLQRLATNIDRKQLLGVYREAFDLPNRITKEIAFQFFSEES